MRARPLPVEIWKRFLFFTRGAEDGGEHAAEPLRLFQQVSLRGKSDEQPGGGDVLFGADVEAVLTQHADEIDQLFR
jgi:hypothetical protein